MSKNIVVRLHAYSICMFLTFATPLAHAIDPITGAWTANAAASAAFGGGVSGGAAALEAAVVSASGAAATVAAAAATAALVAGAGVAAFCATSYLYGANSCGGASGIAGGLQAGGISVGPKGDLVFNPKGYFSVPYKGSTLKFTNATSACNAAVTISNNANAPKYHVLKAVKVFYASGGAIGGADCVTTFFDPNRANSEYEQTGRWVDYQIITTPQKANDEQVAEAVAKSPAAAAAAAAALAQPSLTKAEAAAAAATAAPRTPEAECKAKGMKHGTFNGTVFCVGVSESDTTGAPAGEVGSGTGAGTGAGTANPPATGSNPPAAAALPAFCVYAQTLCEWILWTKAEPAAANPEMSKVDIKDRDASDMGIPPNIDTGRINWSDQCPNPISAGFTLMGQGVDFEYSFEVVCDFAANFRPYVIGLSYLTAGYIVMGLNRTRSE